MAPVKLVSAVGWLATLRQPGFAGGLGLCLLLAAAALATARATGLPAMLLVLAGGMAVRLLFPGFTAWAAAGIAFAATQVLRAGVALLGFRVSAPELLALGWQALALVLASVALTLAGGVAIARVMRQSSDLGAVGATSVAICGASAALAASAAMPRRPGLERETVLVILMVSLLSTLVMLGYPLVARALALSAAETAMLLGAAIHDVAQVAGAGFAVSEPVGVKAVTVKMIRVACLLPVVMGLSFLFLQGGAGGQKARRWRSLRPPTFLVLFFAFAVLTSAALLPAAVSAAAGQVAAFLLAAAVGAIGLKTGFGDLKAARPALAAMLGLVTLWQLAVVLGLILVARG